MSDKRKSRPSFPPFSGGRFPVNRMVFDPLGWGILMAALLYLDLPLYWMLVIVPGWVVVRIVLLCRKELW